MFDWGSENASGISKVKCNLKVNFTFQAKVQERRANTARKAWCRQKHVKNGLAK